MWIRGLGFGVYCVEADNRVLVRVQGTVQGLCREEPSLTFQAPTSTVPVTISTTL